MIYSAPPNGAHILLHTNEAHESPGVTTIYAGTGCAIFWVPFLEQKINFGVSFLVKSQVVITFGVSFKKNNSLGY